MNSFILTLLVAAAVAVNGSAIGDIAIGEEKNGLINLGPITGNRTSRGAGQNLYVSTITRNYFDAIKYCNEGAVVGLADLVQITNSIIDSEINSKLLSLSNIPFWTAGVYTGAGVDGGWRWYTTYNDAPALSYTNWADGQPAQQYAGSSCITFTSSFLGGGKWRAVSCNSYLRFLCFY